MKVTKAQLEAMLAKLVNAIDDDDLMCESDRVCDCLKEAKQLLNLPQMISSAILEVGLGTFELPHGCDPEDDSNYDLVVKVHGKEVNIVSVSVDSYHMRYEVVEALTF